MTLANLVKYHTTSVQSLDFKATTSEDLLVSKLQIGTQMRSLCSLALGLTITASMPF